MMGLIAKIWFLVAILPFVIFLEGGKKFAQFLKKRNIYAHWDVWHSALVVLILLAIFLWIEGFR